ncbi:MAG: rRNA maturation RNase YbeY [Candidatus Omnitrophica bacterium]|nr:rRNA maturation RNase YbeY [Candidatus Omnitrophota bacterium]MDD5770872.1 rRNA maturation RNase YbeY [Candidatus Omnitrophota bacterium]
MINITVSNLQSKVPIPAKRARELARKIIRKESRLKRGYINICFTDDKLIAKLNARFLKTRGPTDVIAFNLDKGRRGADLSADIAISAERAINNARRFKNTCGKELLLYVAHGILHILGFDDRSRQQAKLMRKKENEYVNR